MLGEPILTGLNAPLAYPEGYEGLTVNLEQGHAAFPHPSFQWVFNGAPISQDSWRITTGYPNLVFHIVHRSHAGNYSLSATTSVAATEYFPSAYQPMTTTGQFVLKVYCKNSTFNIIIIIGFLSFTDGPNIVPGSSQIIAVLNQIAILRCGHRIDSNPPPTVTWFRFLSTSAVKEDDDHLFINDAVNGIYHLVLHRVQLNDAGLWTCVARVSENLTDSKGNIDPANPYSRVSSYGIHLSVASEWNAVVFF